MLISAARVIAPTEVLAPGWIETRGDRITAVGSGVPPRSPRHSLPDATLVPGFIDLHVHGGGGASFDGDDPEAAERAIGAHRRYGTTTMLASLVTATLDELERQVAALTELVHDGALAGIHLEGPWLSPRQCGAHNAALLRNPDIDDVARLLRGGRGTIRAITLAPELPGATQATRLITDAGAVAAIGHTDASYDTARKAIEAGATLGTHLFNAMRAVHHREPGPVPALLEDPRVHVELIADGIHLHPAAVSLAARSGRGGFVLVTDAMAAAAADDGDYRLGELDVRVRNGEARLTDTGAIAGSTLTMDAAIRHAVFTAGLPLEDAVRAASTRPAQVLGLSDVGALEVGMRADIVALTEQLHVDAVMRAGTWIREPVPSRRTTS